MQQAHIPALVALEQYANPHPWTAGMFEQGLLGKMQGLVLLVSDQVIAYICWQQVSFDAEILNLAVHPSYQRQGFAKQLLRSLFKQLQTEGVRRVLLEVRASNVVAQQLYQQFGFVTVSKRFGYYSQVNGEREDAYLMNCEI